MRLIFYHLAIILLLLTGNCFGQKLSREQGIEVEALMAMVRNSAQSSDIIFLTNKVLKIDPSNMPAIAYHGIANLMDKDYQAALKDFNVYIENKPKSSFCIYRAQLNVKIGDITNALRDIDMALALSDYDPEISDFLSEFFGTDVRVKNYFEKVVKKHPDNFLGYCALGIIKDKQGDTAAAAEKYTQAVTALNGRLFCNRYKYRWLFWLKASVDFELRHYPEAIETISQVILLSPNDPKYYKNRIDYYLAAGEKEKACVDIGKLLSLGQNYHARQSYTCNFENNKNRPAKNWLAHINAENFYIQGNALQLNNTDTIQKAITLFSKALEIRPDHIYALAGRAFCYEITGAHQKAISDYDKVLQIDPNSAEAFNHRALAKRMLENYEDALTDVNNAIRIDSTNDEYWANRAVIDGVLNDTLKAMNDLSKAVDLNCYSGRRLLERSMFEFYIRKNYEAALKDNLRAIEIAENNPLAPPISEYYSNCAMTYDKLKLYDKAIDQFEKAIAIKPHYALHYYRCGEIRAKMKDLDGACREWNMAKQLGYKEVDELLLYNCQPRETQGK